MYNFLDPLQVDFYTLIYLFLSFFYSLDYSHQTNFSYSKYLFGFYMIGTGFSTKYLFVMFFFFICDVLLYNHHHEIFFSKCSCLF